MTVKRVSLRNPGGISWIIDAESAIPAEFSQQVAEGVLVDVAHPDEPGKRHHIAIQTFAGPVHALPGHVLIRTDAEQVFAITPEGFEKVWTYTH